MKVFMVAVHTLYPNGRETLRKQEVEAPTAPEALLKAFPNGLPGQSGCLVHFAVYETRRGSPILTPTRG